MWMRLELGKGLSKTGPTREKGVNMSFKGKLRALLAGLLAVSPVAGSAYDPIVLKRGWERVAYVKGGGCEAEIGSNGQFYVIAIYGMRPGEIGHFYLTNEDIIPISHGIRANRVGNWSKYYIPFLWHRDSGMVAINIDSQSCSLNLSFEWTRAGVKVHG